MRAAAKKTGIQRFLGLTVGNLSRSINRSLGKRTEQDGVLPGAFATIAWLMQKPGVTQANLSRWVGIEQPTMALTLKRMERDGLIERDVDPEDSRRLLIKLSARGRDVAEALRIGAGEVEAVAQRGLSAAEVTEFYRVAEKMIANLAAERG